MRWASRNTFIRVGRFLGAISDLILARALGFAFGRIFGVGIEPSRRLSLICIPLPALRRRL
jgi:hypothetical protein